MTSGTVAMLAWLLLPLILVTGLGYALARSAWLRPGWQAGLAELTARVLIPALLFSGAFRTGIPSLVSWQLMLAFFGPLVILFAIVCWSRRDAASSARALAATYSNTVFVGIPVLTQALGPASLQVAFPVIAVHGLIAFTLFYLAAPVAKGKRNRLLASLRSTVSNPIVISLMLGLAANAGVGLTGLSLPVPLASMLAMLSAAALPCALLSLGAALATLRPASRAATAVIVGVKLVALPACVLGMAFLLALPSEVAAVLVVLAACPVGVNGAAVVQGEGADAAPVSSAILVSTLLCVLTLPCWLLLIRIAL